jgi:hypothetical protein
MRERLTGKQERQTWNTAGMSKHNELNHQSTQDNT